MEQSINQAWNEAVKSLDGLSPEKRKHLALLIINIAACYSDTGDAGVVVIHRGEELIFFSANADDFECAQLISKANEAISNIVCQDAPAKEMFN